MVVFTCAHCGESLKKNQVKNHYSVSQCGNNVPALTCVDCLKDFKGGDYNLHTSCVTKEERCSAKGVVSKPPSDKAKRKQENWCKFIRKILDSNVEMDGDVKNLLKLIANNPHTPQKRTKFLNFCKYSISFKHPTVLEQAWEFLRKKREEMQNETSDQRNNETNGESGHGKKRKRIDSNNERSTTLSEDGISDPSKKTFEHSGKKKQKQDSFGETQDEAGHAECKKKKSKIFKNILVHENEWDNSDEKKVVGDVVVSKGRYVKCGISQACKTEQKKEKHMQKRSDQHNNETNGESGHGKKHKRIDSNNEHSTTFSEDGISDPSKQTFEHSGKKKPKQDSFRESQEEAGEAEGRKRKSKGFKSYSVHEGEWDNSDGKKVVGEAVESEGRNVKPQAIKKEKMKNMQKRK